MAHVTTSSFGWSQWWCCAVRTRDVALPTFLIWQVRATSPLTTFIIWQVRGLDLRKLDRAQFTQFGRLIDKSFQMPREYQGMSAD